MSETIFFSYFKLYRHTSWLGFRLRFVLERERKTPIAFEADVVVAGGGPAGIGAAVAAARNGTKTILVERYGYLGGLATAGLVIVLPPPPLGGTKGYGGILQEIVDRLFKLGAVQPKESNTGEVIFDPEAFKLVAGQMIEEEGVKLLLDSLVVGAIIEDNTIQGIIVENKSGRQAVTGKVIVDATGDGDIATIAGAPYEKSERGQALPMTLIYIIGGVDNDGVREYQKKDPELRKAARKGGFKCHVWGLKREELRGPSFLHMDQIAKGQVVVWGGSIHADATDAEDLTDAEMRLRERAREELNFLRRHVPGFENSYIAATAPYIGVRETRRIVGKYVLSEKDLKSKKKFPDAIEWYALPFPPHVHNIPYRCLVPKRIDNLLVAGRCYSATHTAQNKVRDIPTCMAMGQAAGTAAALSVKLGVRPRQIDVGHLREILVEQGAYVKKA